MAVIAVVSHEGCCRKRLCDWCCGSSVLWNFGIVMGVYKRIVVLVILIDNVGRVPYA